MTATSRSLMDFVDTPVLVGDPDGRAVYVNPAFERDFQLDAARAVGTPLATLFDGGGREAVLGAVAQVCQGSASETVRFGVRVGERGYLGMASPVEAQAGRVGVILLLTREAAAEGRLQSFRREILTPLDELSGCFDRLLEWVGGEGAEQCEAAIEDGIHAIERMRKWASGVAARLSEGQDEGRGTRKARRREV